MGAKDERQEGERAMWDRALSDAEIAAVCRYGALAVPAGLVYFQILRRS